MKKSYLYIKINLVHKLNINCYNLNDFLYIVNYNLEFYFYKKTLVCNRKITIDK